MEALIVEVASQVLCFLPVSFDDTGGGGPSEMLVRPHDQYESARRRILHLDFVSRTEGV